MKKSQRLKIKITFSALLMLAALAISHSFLSVAALIAATLHEIGHIIAAKMLSAPLSTLRLGIFGASLSTREEISSYKNEILIAAAGPAVNIVCFLAFLPLADSMCRFGQMLMASSLFLGTLNLLPISDFDGGRILFCSVAIKHSLAGAHNTLSICSFISLFALWSLSVYIIIRLGASLSLFVFSSSVFCKIFIKPRSEF